MRLTTLLLLPLLFFGSCSSTGKVSLPSVSLVYAVNARGSAIPVFEIDGKTFFLTAKHVIADLVDGIDDEAQIFNSTVRGKPIIDIFVHPKLDVALISARLDKSVGLARLAPEMPRYPARLYAIGWHLGEVLLLTEGHAANEVGYMSCPIIFGASGGAVLNGSIELVGVVSKVAMIGTGGFEAHPIPHVSIYVPVEKFRDWFLKTKAQAR